MLTSKERMKERERSIDWLLLTHAPMGGRNQQPRYIEDGGKIGGSRVHFPSAPMKRLADLRPRANS